MHEFQLRWHCTKQTLVAMEHGPKNIWRAITQVGKISKRWEWYKVCVLPDYDRSKSVTIKHHENSQILGNKATHF